MKIKNEFKCKCGKVHKAKVEQVIIKKGAIKEIIKIMKKYGVKKPFILCDQNTFNAGGKKLEEIFIKNKIPFSHYIFNDNKLEPDEKAVGSAVMHFDNSCDFVIGVGSGVINDIGKILSSIKNCVYIIVATAPSMDGYASASSSMNRDGLKISLSSKCPNVVIGDIDILKNAPLNMLKSGLGDMLAKYISILEWKISHLINGEYYCEKIANLIKKAVKDCVDNIDGLLKREEKAITAVFNGLILGGVAMNYAGCSRPASGVEHYISHVFDMRSLEFNEKCSTHGIQCAIGTFYAIGIYSQILNINIDKEKALKKVQEFDYEKYCCFLRKFLGKSAESMISLEKKEGKYDKKKHKQRLNKIIENFQEIKRIIKQEILPLKEYEKILDKIDCPKRCRDIGLKNDLIKDTFIATKDIRDKYVLSRLCFDLGVMDEINFDF